MTDVASGPSPDRGEEERLPAPLRWLRGIGSSPEEHAYGRLLEALAQRRAEVEGRVTEMDADADRPPADLADAKLRTEEESREAARAELADFQAALADARTQAAERAHGEARYDARDPVQDRRADVLIQYLVRPGFAEVRTEEPEAGRFVYYVRVLWDPLRGLAREVGGPGL